jgi:tetratricopeptide (TPR) repeat protein
MSRTFHPVHLLLPGLAAVVLATAAGLRAEERVAERSYQFSDETSEELAKYKTAEDAKNYDLAISIIDARLAKIPDHNSYDYGMLQEYKAQALLQKGELIKAIEPLELGLQISDAHSPTYSDERVTLELCYYLAQLYFQQAITAKTVAASTPYYEKAELYITRWVKMAKKPTVDALTFYASLLYNRAIVDADHPDADKITRAMAVVDQALHLATHPKDNLYVLKLVCLQQLNRTEESTELLELLVKVKPENKTYWQQLAALYLSLGQQVRAILTFERAQAQGLMNAPKDNFNLVGIYFNLAQYEHAAVLLEKGLHEGTIENEQKNWELLSFSYQQLNRDFKAIDALKQAAKNFPASSQLEYLIAQNYYALDKNADALAHLQECVTKGGGAKPAQTYMFLAYVALELKKYDVALEAANKALTFPEVHDKAVSMKKAVEGAMALREEKLKKM